MVAAPVLIGVVATQPERAAADPGSASSRASSPSRRRRTNVSAWPTATADDGSRGDGRQRQELVAVECHAQRVLERRSLGGEPRERGRREGHGQWALVPLRQVDEGFELGALVVGQLLGVIGPGCRDTGEEGDAQRLRRARFQRAAIEEGAVLGDDVAVDQDLHGDGVEAGAAQVERSLHRRLDRRRHVDAAAPSRRRPTW